MKITDQKFIQRMRDGAKLYAKADRSDPFAYARAITHILSDICGYNEKGEEAFYNALEYPETRKTEWGEKYIVPAYRNMVRP